MVTKLKSLLNIVERHEFVRLNAVFWLGGILVGVAAVILAKLSQQCYLFFQQYIASQAYLVFITTPLALVVIAFVTRKAFHGAEGSGVPQVIAALNPRCRNVNRLLSLRTIAGKFLILPALMFGASIGREGPSIQIGAAIMLSLAPLAKTKYYDCRHALIMTGGAAGIGAAFNAPLAGIVFAIECLAKRFEHHISDVMLGSVALGSLVGYFALGHSAHFGAVQIDASNNQLWLAVLSMGIIGGLMGGLFTTCFIIISKWMARLGIKKSLVITALFGLGIAILGYLSNGFIFGSGYAQSSAIISGHQYPDLYPLYKAIANLLSSTSGIPGGIFSPSLTVGASLGQMLSHYFPSVDANLIVMTGMVSFFCGVTQTPITCFAIVAEMQHVTAIAVPLIIASLVAKLLSSIVCKKPFFDALADMLIKQS